MCFYFFFFDMFLFFTKIFLRTTFVQCIKTNIAITEMKNNEPSEYESCYWSSTTNKLTKS